MLSVAQRTEHSLDNPRMLVLLRYGSGENVRSICKTLVPSQRYLNLKTPGELIITIPLASTQRCQLSTASPYHIFKTALEHAVLHLISIHPARVHGLLMADLDSRRTPSSSGGVGHHLRLDTAVQSTEEISRSIHSLAHSQDTMVLKDNSLVVAQRLRNVTPFLMSKDDTTKVVVDRVVLVEAAGILVDGLKLAAHGAEGLGRERVAVDGGDDVRTCLVDGGVDRKACRIDGVHVAFGLNDALFVDETEVLGAAVLEGFAEGVDPKVVWLDRVPHGDVSTSALVVVSTNHDYQ